jgi:hypothetical protein
VRLCRRPDSTSALLPTPSSSFRFEAPLFASISFFTGEGVEVLIVEQSEAIQLTMHIFYGIILLLILFIDVCFQFFTLYSLGQGATVDK